MAESWSKRSTSSKESNSNSESSEETADKESGKASLKDPNRQCEEQNSTVVKKESEDTNGDSLSNDGLRDTSDEEQSDKVEEHSNTLVKNIQSNNQYSQQDNCQDDTNSEHTTDNGQDDTIDQQDHETHVSNSSNKTSSNVQQPEGVHNNENNNNESNSHTEENTANQITLNGEDQTTNEEDKVNTQTSDQTLTQDNVESNIPPWFRFCLIVKMPQLPTAILAQQQRGEQIPEEYRDNDKRLLKIVKSFFTHIKGFDDTAMILEWSARNDNDGVDALLNPEGIPTALSEIKTFFKGFKGKKSGPVYIKFRATTKFSHDDFLVNAKSWVNDNDCS